jgi:cytoskeletal protein RodZ
MATLDITDVRPNGNSFAEGSLKPDEHWAPPLAPNGRTAAGGVLLREELIDPAVGGEDPFEPPEPSHPSETIGSRRNLIAGTAIIAALGVAGLTYFFLASPGANAPAETAESPAIAAQSSSETPVQAAVNVPAPTSPTTVEPSSETPVQPAPAAPEPARGASAAAPWPDVPASVTAKASTAEASPQGAPSAETPQTTSAVQNQDLVFLQRPGVNIRSAPSLNAPVLGTAPKGTQFTATSREGDWVQVESTRWKGWISSQFLAPDRPL